MRAFISHARADKPSISLIVEAIHRMGVAAFIDDAIALDLPIQQFDGMRGERLASGEDWRLALRRKLSANPVLVCFSKEFSALRGRQVLYDEVLIAAHNDQMAACALDGFDVGSLAGHSGLIHFEDLQATPVSSKGLRAWLAGEAGADAVRAGQALDEVVRRLGEIQAAIDARNREIGGITEGGPDLALAQRLGAAEFGLGSGIATLKWLHADGSVEPLNFAVAPPGRMETPVGEVEIPRAFAISTTPILSGVPLSWREADAACAARGGRLPSEVEWEYALFAPRPDRALPGGVANLWGVQGAPEAVREWVADGFAAPRRLRPDGSALISRGRERVMKAPALGRAFRRGIDASASVACAGYRVVLDPARLSNG